MKKLKITKKQAKTGIVDILFFTFGSALYSAGILCFAAPNNIAPGGASGLATIINYLFSVPIGLTVLIINIPLILISWKKIGSAFVSKTAIATVLLSAILEILSPFIPHYTGDLILASIFGGALSGIGLALFFVRGATSGGTDLIARLLQKKFPYLPTGRFILLIDAAIVAFSAIVYKNVESALYAMIYIFISTQVIDSVLFGQINAKVLTIITSHGTEISEKIVHDFSRGATLLKVKGGYTEAEKSMVYCAVRKTQVSAITKAIREIDSKAFIVISKADEIVGEFDR